MPDPWVRLNDPPPDYMDLYRALRGTHRLPPIRDPVATTAQWAAGRLLSVNEAVTEALAFQIDAPAPASKAPFGLTTREREVLRLVTAGHSNRAIGDRLFLSERTVENRVQHIMAKLGVDSRTADGRLRTFYVFG